MTEAVKPSKGFFEQVYDGAKKAVGDIKDQAETVVDFAKKEPVAAVGLGIVAMSGVGAVAMGFSEVPRKIFDKCQTVGKLWGAFEAGSVTEGARHAIGSAIHGKVDDLTKALNLVGVKGSGSVASAASELKGLSLVARLVRSLAPAAAKTEKTVPAALAAGARDVKPPIPVAVRSASNAASPTPQGYNGASVFDRLRSVVSAMEERILKKAGQGKLTEGFIEAQARSAMEKTQRLIGTARNAVGDRIADEIRVVSENSKKLVTPARDPNKTPFIVDRVDRKLSPSQLEILAGKKDRLHHSLSLIKSRLEKDLPHPDFDPKNVWGNLREAVKDLKDAGHDAQKAYGLAIKGFVRNGQNTKAMELRQAAKQFDLSKNSVPLAARAPSGAATPKFQELKPIGKLYADDLKSGQKQGPVPVFDRLRNVVASMEKRIHNKAREGNLSEGFIEVEARSTLEKVHRLVDQYLSGQKAVKSRVANEISALSEQSKKLLRAPSESRTSFDVKPLETLEAGVTLPGGKANQIP